MGTAFKDSYRPINGKIITSMTQQSVKIEKGIGKDDYLMVHANVLPTKAIISKIKKLKNGEFLTSGKEGGWRLSFQTRKYWDCIKLKLTVLLSLEGK